MADKLIVPGLTQDEQAELSELWEQLCKKMRRNVLRASYYDGKNAMRHLGMSMPPSFRQIATILGWPAKAVDTLNSRCRLEGFAAAGVDLEALGADQVWADNRLALEAPQAGVSSLIHSVAWLITTRGDDAKGEPPALITTRDAMTGSALWDARQRRVRAFLSIVDVDDKGKPLEFVLYLDVVTVVAVRDGWKWIVDRRPQPLGRPPVEPLAFKPRIGRPFGSSRISRAVMSMTDLAMRTVLRSEVNAELYSVPQRILLGANENDFKNPDGSTKAAWQVVFGRIWALSRDEDGEMPQLEQLQQSSQEPHMQQLKALAQLFAGETSIPVSSLGISSEANPASAEAYYASREDLIALAETADDGWSPAWERSMITALQIVHDEAEAPAEWSKIRARFRSPAHTSRTAAADAMLKLSQSFPWMTESDTTLELLGLDQNTVDRLLADKRKAQARGTLAALAAAAPAGQTATAAAGPEATKEQADALGALIRAGVDPTEAAQRVGLAGIKFTGAVPVSLRLPASEAADVEDR